MSNPSPSPSPSSVRPIAVIDIGTTAIRMTVAQVDEAGLIHPLDNLQKPVQLGMSTFSRGSIRRDVIEESVQILKSFGRSLQELGIQDPSQIRAVATSAVREASNRQQFLDRVYIATGIQVEAIDEAEVARYTYLAVRPYLLNDPLASKTDSLIVEAAGGSTEVIHIEGDNVIHSQAFRLGSSRLRQMISGYRASSSNVRDLLENHLDRAMQQVRYALPLEESVNIIALGGDMRFAARELIPSWDPARLGRMTVAALQKFTDELLALSVDELVRQYRMSFPDAETIGPALLIYLRLARLYKAKHILVTSATMRNGLLQEMASQDAWTDEFKEQIIRSALDLGRKYHFDEAHAQHVAVLCRVLFKELQEDHQLGPRFDLLLNIAALLHEVGLFVGNRSHHKHSMYLILHSDMFGLGQHDTKLVALIARYHRRASPKATHLYYDSLDREDRVVVAKLASILRIADALERSHSQRVRKIQCRREGDTLIIAIPHARDLTMEQHGLEEKGRMFEDVYGLKISLQKTLNG